MSAKTMTDSFRQLHQEHVGDERPTPPAPNPAPAPPAPSTRPTPVPTTAKAKAPSTPTPEKTKNLHIRIPENVHKALRRMSAETDRTHRDLVADAIESFVAKYKD
ncbi:MAG: hypothetical protein OXI15_02360 [Chromatiales bacterium]|nr:hypothetical protein [Chromatiales bacterium]